MTGDNEDKNLKASRPVPVEAEQKAQSSPRPENLPDGGLKECDARIAPLADELQAHA